jgi:hypothetical protein
MFGWVFNYILVYLIRLNLGSWWLRSCGSCNLRLVKRLSLSPSMEVLTTSSCWSRTSNTFRSHLQWRNATSCLSNCFTLALLGCTSCTPVVLAFDIIFHLVGFGGLFSHSFASLRDVLCALVLYHKNYRKFKGIFYLFILYIYKLRAFKY